MLLKFVVILLLLLSLTLAQFSPQNDKIDDIFGNNQATTVNPINEDLYDGIFDTDEPDDPTEIVSSTTMKEKNKAECECIPYYLCDSKETKRKTHYGEGLIDTRLSKRTQCPHYLLKCCDDEDLSDYVEEAVTTTTTTTTTQRSTPQGCGYRHVNFNNFLESFTQLGEFPWVVLIYYANFSHPFNFVCGGSLIHPEVVLTAAHCIRDFKNRPRVRIGEWDSRKPNFAYLPQDIEVASISIHSKFTPMSLHNDIALLFLKYPVKLGININIICLPPLNFVIDTNRCVFTSWDQESFSNTNILKKSQLPIVDRKQCQQDLRFAGLGRQFNLHNSFICAGGEKNRTTCNGYSGNGLVCLLPGENRFYQIGIASWGVKCGGFRIPDVYVNILHFRNWIDEKLRRKNIDISVYQF